MIRTSAIILAMFIAALLPVSAQVPKAPMTAQFMFPVGILCDLSSERFQEGVVSGDYQTVVHVFNPSASEEAALAKTVVRALPYQRGLPPTAVVEDRLKPGAAIAIECNEIRQLLPDTMSASFKSGYLVLYSDRDLDVSVGYSAKPRGGEITTQDQARIESLELCPLSMGEAGDRIWSDKICLSFAWTCDDPETLSVALDGESRGTILLNRTEDYLLSDGSSTFCASTTHLADGSHNLAATLSCAKRACTLDQPFEVANTPFELVSVVPDRRRYRGSDTVEVTVMMSRNIDEVDADFSILDTAFDAENLTIEQSGAPGTYLISYRIAGFDNTNPPGIYQVPLTFRDGTVTRSFTGLRIGYVGETDNLLYPVDLVPTTTVVGAMPQTDTSPVAITELTVSNALILPLTTVTVTGTIEAPFITDRPRAEVEAAAVDYSLVWRESDADAAGAYRLRPAMLTFDCAADGLQLCSLGQFTVELGFPIGNNALAETGPHERTLRFAILDPGGRISEAASTAITIVVLSDQAFAGTSQDSSGSSEVGTVGEGVEFRLHHGAGEGEPANPLTLILTWDGENGPGAEVIPGENELPQTLTALDLNIGIHRAPADGHGGWFGNLGNAELVRKSNTCFSGFGLGQPSPDRFACVCSDASNLNMEIIAYPPGSELDVGGDGEGTFGAEYYIYDSCGSQQDTTATLTAYYCGIVQQESFAIDAHLSEEDEDLDSNWNNSCLFGSPCHDPKTVPTGFNETGGFYEGFDFNPNDCSARPTIAGHVGYKAPINFALNDPSAAGILHDPDPALDQSWSFLDEDLNATGWTDFDAPFAKIEVTLVDGSEETVGETFTDEDGNFRLILDPDYAANGESGLVRVEIVALSAAPYSYRVIQDLDDLDAAGTDVLHRVILADDFDPVANAGVPIEAVLNAGPQDLDSNMEAAAAFHILRNTTLAAQYLQSLGKFVEPFTALYDRDTALTTNTCARAGSFYNGSGRYAHFQSTGPNVVQQVCPAGQADPNGVCAVACIADPSGARYTESRVDFTYATHMHEYVHHVTGVLTTIGPWRPDKGRASASHFGNTGEKTSLTEGIATAMGTALASNLIYDMFGAGEMMNPVMIECTVDDLTNCDLSLVESVDWLTTRDKDNGAIVRPGPDWQPQKDCPPGTLGCGCSLGTCSDASHSCEGGYCVDPSGACTPGTRGCVPDASGVCADNIDLHEHGQFCVLPVTYSDGWTWRLLWDLLDEDEDVQPEVSHWRTSQMSNANPDVGPIYDSFGSFETFWRTMIESVGNEAETPITVDNFHPNVADLVERFRCTLDDDGQASLDNYLAAVVEFPYYNPAAPCP